MSERNRPRGFQNDALKTSRSLLQRVREDDAGAWERLVELYAPLVYYWCRRQELPEHDIADVFQEVFQSVADNLDKFRKQRPEDTFRGWLRIITRNKINDHFRRQNREPAAARGGTDAQAHLLQISGGRTNDSDSVSDSIAAANMIERQLLRRALDAIRQQFADQTWRAFWRTAVDGQSAVDVAAELDMSPGAVRVAKSRVLNRLRSELGDR